MMRYPLILLICLLMLGCTKDRNVLFEVPLQLNFEMPAGLNPFEKHFQLIRNVRTNFSSLRQQFNVAEDQEIAIRPGSAILTSISSNIDFDFVEEFGIFLYEDDPDDEVDAFLTDQVPFNAGRNVVILPFDTDLSALLTQETVNFKIAFRLRAPTPSFIDTHMELIFTVE